MRHAGKLKSWNADRGFGFIALTGQDDVFVHIGAFARDGVAPVPGEPLWFEIGSDARGRRCAIRLSRTAGGEAVKLGELALEPIAPARDAAARVDADDRVRRVGADRRPRAAGKATIRDTRRTPEGASGRRDGGRRGGRYRLLVLTTLVILAVAGWDQLQRHRTDPAAEPADLAEPATPEPLRSCDGRLRCNQMTSCDEATWFLRHCPGTEMDGDHDGVPCEQQWCGGRF
ncbi:excalibur calcium-binding domain-containing protein [Derxia gummosa]|uniref:Excalibur calcium-binding domain-containing protein n=1 Tax=Derxia gummosa DSM 723 TaxID=1121388 RepID=A0A9U5FZ22_9BURK|nr:excalibur calcium-binding domain-containing protein [Derxia gummosa]